ncbi:MAG TPA: hypothetical protein VJ180_08545 [Pyrinomonadaceae bacterium]|nr:hypothetical protein [Pyrinomonadaceae bacterium]
MTAQQFKIYCEYNSVPFDIVIQHEQSGALIPRHPNEWANPPDARPRLLRVMDVSQLISAYRHLVDERGIFVG